MTRPKVVAWGARRHDIQLNSMADWERQAWLAQHHRRMREWREIMVTLTASTRAMTEAMRVAGAAALRAAEGISKGMRGVRHP